MYIIKADNIKGHICPWFNARKASPVPLTFYERLLTTPWVPPEGPIILFCLCVSHSLLFFIVIPNKYNQHSPGSKCRSGIVGLWSMHMFTFLYFFALIAEEGFLISSCYSLELCIQMLICFLLCKVNIAGMISSHFLGMDIVYISLVL